MKKLVSIHAPVRERPEFDVAVNTGFGVSIHAPVRERRLPLLTHIFAYGFNSRSRKGATFMHWFKKSCSLFQFTLP